jgi:hypothetical protein
MRARKQALGAAALLVAIAAGGCGSSGGGGGGGSSGGGGGGASHATRTSASSAAPIHGRYAPRIDPANFVSSIDNRYFPLAPGTGYHYRGVAEDGKTPQTDDMVVTHRTKRILGVAATVVRDTVSSRGRTIERTFDWYAQDRQGNVWYMGELARERHHGRFVTADDSWQAGLDGAQAGIIMPGDPRPGEQYRQEYYPGHALDQARVLGPGGKVTVPDGSFPRTLLTVETAPKLDPGVAERKYYVAGLGDVKEQTVSGNRERIDLIRVTH